MRCWMRNDERWREEYKAKGAQEDSAPPEALREKRYLPDLARGKELFLSDGAPSGVHATSMWLSLGASSFEGLSLQDSKSRFFRTTFPAKRVT
uniref:Uncharacterized protein n=1 Tax=Candidatus Kentrum sp. TC TaxID=2126339 RepID=A0A450YJU6_9GAMM|nr:MAG: hypothetical protein BECKTC1821D_GA0114238_100657 [Candidatus Kentron sp. TC]VFK41804.1 MAG: hypothetical protein BECKTC1821E_GA0114239_101442 [Candidatus Kentron sp. TC]